MRLITISKFRFSRKNSTTTEGRDSTTRKTQPTVAYMKDLDLDSMYKRLIKAGNQTGKDQQPGLILSFDAYCSPLGVEPNKQHYDKWKETASLEAWEKQNNTDQ